VTLTLWQLTKNSDHCGESVKYDNTEFLDPSIKHPDSGKDIDSKYAV